MNYYQHHIGDYRRDTAHLSLLEHGVYRQLLDWYYLSEDPIPKETQVVFRRLCARTEAEFEAIETVLKEFFFLDSGWHHKRCDAEIQAYQSNCKKNKLNGKLGGRPKKTQSVILGFENETQTKPKQKATNNQEPLTNNQEPITKVETEQLHKNGTEDVKKSREVRATRFNSAQKPPDQWLEFCKDERPDLDAALTFDRFADYWAAVPGAKGRKLDWFATWRNWVRSEKRTHAANRHQAEYVPTFKERDQRRAMEEMEQWTGKTHPELERMRQRERGNIIDITPKMELIA